MDKPLGGLRASPPGKFLGPVLFRKRNLVIRVFFFFFFFLVVVFFLEREKKNTIAALLYSSLIIVKSLQLRGHRQIAEPRKYCLVHVIVFFGVCFFYFFVSHRLGIRVNSLHQSI